MKRFVCLWLVFGVMAMTFAVPFAVAEENVGPIAKAQGLTVERFVLTTDIVEREPVDSVMNFNPGTEKAFAFVELRDVEFNTQVTVVWSYNGEEVALVPLMVGASSRWRTYSSKNIAGLPGQWKVELISDTSEILTAIEFVVN